MAQNSSEMNKNYPFWVRIHFGYFKPWFGAIFAVFITLFAAGGSVDPLAPPGAPWRPPEPPPQNVDISPQNIDIRPQIIDIYPQKINIWPQNINIFTLKI